MAAEALKSRTHGARIMDYYPVLSLDTGGRTACLVCVPGNFSIWAIFTPAQLRGALHIWLGAVHGACQSPERSIHGDFTNRCRDYGFTAISLRPGEILLPCFMRFRAQQCVFVTESLTTETSIHTS
jgi:hypothetical protein